MREAREELNVKNSFLTRNRKEIDVVFQDKETVEDIIETLSNFGTEFGLKTIELLTKMSPIILKATLESLSWGLKLDIKDCLKWHIEWLKNHDKRNQFL